MQEPRIDLSGKTALVTGASRGIGLAIAQAFVQCGADVIGVGTKITSQDLAPLCQGQPGSFQPLDCDLSDRNGIDAMISGLDDKGGRSIFWSTTQGSSAEPRPP